MAINTNTIESNLTTKLNNTSGTTDAKEFLLLGKAVEALQGSVTIQDVIDEGSTQITNVQTEGATQVAAVQAAGTGYVSNTGGTVTGILNVDTFNANQIATFSSRVNLASGQLLDGNSATYFELDPLGATQGSASSTAVINLQYPYNKITLAGNCTFTPTNLVAGRTSMVHLDRSASGYTPSFVADLKWSGAQAPTWSDHRYWVITLTCYDTAYTFASASGFTI